MTTLWIVHRDARTRAMLARLVGARPDTIVGAPGDRVFESARSADVIVLGLAGDFEVELEFVHRLSRQLPGCGWILLAEPHDREDARRLFDILPATILEFPTDGASLRRQIRSVLHQRPVDALSQRRSRDLLAARFTRWFADLELPEVLRALDPHLVAVPVLIRGEPGTGRALLAAYIQAFGGTTGGALARISCVDLGLGELTNEIHGATNWAAARQGVTICLEDLDRLPASTQRQLRNWIEGGLPRGAVGTDRLRWIATCGEDGPEDPAVALDPGLAHALSGLSVRIPPLRERRHSIESFVTHTAEEWLNEQGEPAKRFSEEALDALRAHSWPWNLRELEAVVHRTLACGCGELVRAEDLRFEVGLGAAAALAAPPFRPSRPTEVETESGAERPPALAPRPEPLDANPPTALHMDADPLRRLSGAIAHSVRNPLVAIRTFAQMLPERFDDPEFRERFSSVLNSDVQRIEQVVDELAHFSDLGTPQNKPVDLVSLLDELLEAQRDEIRARRLVVLKELDRSQPAVLGDAGQLRFAFELLLRKSLELVAERGDIYIASKHHANGPGGRPSVRVLLRSQSPDEGAPRMEVEGLSLAETALEIVVAEVIIRSRGGTLTAAPSDSREMVIVIDLPAP